MSKDETSNKKDGSQVVRQLTLSLDSNLEKNTDSSGKKDLPTKNATAGVITLKSTEKQDEAKCQMSNKCLDCLLIFKPNMEVLWQRLFIVIILLLIVQLTFAGLSVVSVLFVKNVKLDVGLLILCRCLIAATFSVPMALFFEGKYSLYQYNKASIAFFFILGIVFSAGNPILYQLCIKFTTGSFAALMQQLVPVFSFIFSMILKVEPPPSIKDKSFIVKLVGLIICVSSAVGISALNFTDTSKITWGNWLIGTILAVITYTGLSLYMVLQAKIIFTDPNHPLCKKPFTVNSLASIYGTLLYIPLCGIYMLTSGADLSINPGGEISILYAGFVVSVVGYTCMVISIQLSSPMISSCLYSLQVVTAMIMLRFIANESMSTVQYVISIGVIGGALMVILSPLLKEPPKA